MKPSADKTYRKLIDRLVHSCREGQGQLGATRARAAVWNANATARFAPDQHENNKFLARLTPRDREVLAAMLTQQFQAGVHAALVALHEEGIEPFDAAYEGAPINDFAGRLDDWPWPKSTKRFR